MDDTGDIAKLSAELPRRWHDQYPGLTRGPMSADPYRSEAFFQSEREHVFRPSWLCVGRVEEIAKPGDFFVKDLPVCDASLVITRDRTGAVRALHNVCGHRQNKLVWEDRGHKTRFSCRYHGWTYASNGDLIGVPDEAGYFDLDRGSCALRQAHVEAWNGFIFVNLSAQPPLTLREFLDEPISQLEGYPFHKMTSVYAWKVMLDCNWKVALDNFQEVLHVNYVHTRSVADTSPNDGRYGVTDMVCGLRHRRMSFLSNPDHPYAIASSVASAGRDALDVAKANPRNRITMTGLKMGIGNIVPGVEGEFPVGLNPRRHPHWLMDINIVFPNFWLSVRPHSYSTYSFQPLARDRTEMEMRFHYTPAKNASGRFSQEVVRMTMKEVFLEDTYCLEQVQKGLDTFAVDTVNLHDGELMVRHNLEVISRMIQAAEAAK